MIKIGNDYYTVGDICCGVVMVVGIILAVIFLAFITVGVIVFTHHVITGEFADTPTFETQEVE